VRRLSTKSLLPLFLLAVLLLFGWTLKSGLHFYHEEREKVQEKKGKEQSYMENIHLTSTKEGKVLWILDAARAKMVDKVIHLWNLKIKYIYQKGKPVIITAQKGILDNKKKLGKIWGDVTIRFQGETLKVDEMVWDLDKNTIETSLPFKVTGKTLAEGTGFVAKPSAGWVKVKKLKKVVIR